MATFGDIVAYSYQADLYGPECIMAVLNKTYPHWALLWDTSVEGQLNNLAAILRINREDEATFDSGDFPKVVLYDHLHDQGERFYCGHCHEELEN